MAPVRAIDDRLQVHHTNLRNGNQVKKKNRKHFDALCGIRTSHAVPRFQTFDFNGESSKLDMLENLPRPRISLGRQECFIARGSYIPNQTNARSCSGFELFFDSWR